MKLNWLEEFDSINKRNKNEIAFHYTTKEFRTVFVFRALDKWSFTKIHTIKTPDDWEMDPSSLKAISNTECIYLNFISR